MRFITLKAEEFNAKTRHLPCANFHQTANWGKLKSYTGWIPHHVALEDEGKIVAASLLLAKKTPLFNSYLFYAPRGFLIDFNDKELLDTFTKEVLGYVKKHKGFELLIDPYLEYRHRDIEGEIIDDGFDNQSVVDQLLSLGFHHNNGFNLYNENLQPRWLYVVDIKDKDEKAIIKDFKSEVKRRAKKKDFFKIDCRELKADEIHLYKEVMQHTAKRRGFLDRSETYYKHMYETMHDDGILRYFVAEIDFRETLANIKMELDASKAKLEALKAKDTQFTKTKNEIKEEEVRLTSYQKSYDTISRYADGRSGKHVISGVTLLTYGDEAVQLLAGNYDEFEILYSSTILITELIKMIKKEGYSRYNFYGITGDFSNDNPLIGLYTFKKSFGGHVVELIGEFEYVISRPMKTLYELGIKCYNAMKKVRD